MRKFNQPSQWLFLPSVLSGLGFVFIAPLVSDSSRPLYVIVGLAVILVSARIFSKEQPMSLKEYRIQQTHEGMFFVQVRDVGEQHWWKLCQEFGKMDYYKTYEDAEKVAKKFCNEEVFH